MCIRSKRDTMRVKAFVVAVALATALQSSLCHCQQQQVERTPVRTVRDVTAVRCEIDTSRRLHLTSAATAAAIVQSCLQLYRTSFLGHFGSTITSSNGSVSSWPSSLRYFFLSEVLVGSENCLPQPASGFANFQWSVLEPLLSQFRPLLRVECVQDLVTFAEPFANVSTIAGLVLRGNPQLVSFSGFDSLSRVNGRLEFVDNWRLQRITAFRSLQVVGGYLRLERNSHLHNVNFPALHTLGGTAPEHGAFGGDYALVVVNNALLNNILGFGALQLIDGGTVRIEDNCRLCLPGYPQWTSSSLRTRSFAYPSADTGALGVDWRLYLSAGVSCWKFSWQTDSARRIPTMKIAGNGEPSACGAGTLRCSSACESSCWAAGDRQCGRTASVQNATNCTDSPPLATPSSISSTPRTEPVSRGGAAAAGDDDDALYYWVPPWKMPGLLIFALAMVAAVAILITVVVCCVKWRRRVSKNMGVTRFDVAEDSSSKKKELKDTTITVSTFQGNGGFTAAGRYGHHGDHGRLLADDETDFAESCFETRIVAGLGDENEETEESETGRAERGPALGEESLQDGSFKIIEGFPRDQLEEGGRLLGEAAVWTVYEKKARRLIPGMKRSKVVALVLASSAEEDQKEFLEYVGTLRLQHENIVRLLAVSMETVPFLALCEPYDQGNLKSYLIRCRGDRHATVSRGLLLQAACDISSAVAYLHSNSVICRELATHSCQLTYNLSVKLGDYGLSMTLFPEDFCSLGEDEEAGFQAPLRWLAPEQVLQLSKRDGEEQAEKTRLFAETAESNAWSLGVTVAEVLAFAGRPYADMPDDEVLSAFHAASTDSGSGPGPFTDISFQGDYLDAIAGKLWRLAQSCMEADVEKRPTSAALHRKILFLRQEEHQKAMMPNLSSARHVAQSAVTPGQVYSPSSFASPYPAGQGSGQLPPLAAAAATSSPYSNQPSSGHPNSRSASHPPVHDSHRPPSSSKVANQHLQQQQSAVSRRKRSALKKPQDGQTQTQLKKRVEFKEGTELTEVRKISQEEDGGRRGLKVSNSQQAPALVDPLAQFDHLADLTFDDDYDDEEEGGPSARAGQKNVAFQVTDVDSHPSVASGKYVDTLQRKKKKKRLQVDGLMQGSSRANDHLEAVGNGQVPTGAHAPSQSATNDDVMIW